MISQEHDKAVVIINYLSFLRFLSWFSVIQILICIAVNKLNMSSVEFVWKYQNLKNLWISFQTKPFLHLLFIYLIIYLFIIFFVVLTAIIILSAVGFPLQIAMIVMGKCFLRRFNQGFCFCCCCCCFRLFVCFLAMRLNLMPNGVSHTRNATKIPRHILDP